MPSRKKNPAQSPAVVIDLQSMCGLQTARILARHEIPVFAIASQPHHPHCRTSVCEEILFADSGTDDLVPALEKLGAQLETKAVAYPCSDQAMMKLSTNRNLLARYYHIALPAADIVELLANKLSFYRWAQARGLPLPTTFFLYDRSDMESAATRLTYPCVLKPAVKTPAWGLNAEAKAYKIHSAGELRATYLKCAAWAEVLIAQQWIEGGDANLYSCNCYFNAKSEPLVAFVARKLRQWPPETGCSCLGEECRNDVVLRQTIELFQSLGWQGLAYLEMKRDERDGTHYIIEPNIGRPTGRSAIAEAGGVELLYTMYCDILKQPLPANRRQTYTGAKWIDFHHDLQSAAWHWRRGHLTMADVLRSWRGVKIDALFSWADPRPFLCEMWGVFGRALSPGAAGGRVPVSPATSPKKQPEPEYQKM